MLDFLRANGLTLWLLFITHTHPDHIADIASLNAEKVLVNERDGARSEDLPGGNYRRVGLRRAEDRSSQHLRPQQGRHHLRGHGLAQPVAVVGDALFASSMGGGMVSFSDALDQSQ